MGVLGWRVWYDDGQVYDSATQRWADLPEDGVLVRMIYYDGGGKQIQQGCDYYYEAPHFSGEVILGAGGNRDHIAKRYPGASIKRGRWCPDGFYSQVCAAAHASTWDG